MVALSGGLCRACRRPVRIALPSRSIGSVLCPCLRGCHVSNAAMTPRLLKAFTQNGADRPRLLAITPPSAGPIARLTLIPMLFAAMAGPNSVLGTSCGTTACQAGDVKATAALLTNVNTSRFSGLTAFIQTRTAKIVPVNVMLISPTRRNRRLSTISVSAPAGIARRNIGRVDAVWTNPTITGSGWSVVISQAEAALYIQPPMLETTVASQIVPKRRCRKGASAELTNGFSISRLATGCSCLVAASLHLPLLRRSGCGSPAFCRGRHRVPQLYLRFHASAGLLDDVIRRTPSAGFAKQDDRGSAEIEQCFLFTAPERLIQPMDLNDASDRHRADFRKGELPEIRGVQDVHRPFIDKQDVVLRLQCFPLHGPKASPDVVVLKCLSIIGVMHTVIVDRGQATHQDRAANVGPCALFAAKDEVSAQGVSFDRKLLVGIELLPAEISGLREGTHVARLRREAANAVAKLPHEKFRVRPINDRLELGHVDVMLLDERLDVFHGPARVLKRRSDPIVQGLRLEPPNNRSLGPRLVGRGKVVRKLLKKLLLLTVPYGKGFGLGHGIPFRPELLPRSIRRLPPAPHWVHAQHADRICGVGHPPTCRRL